MKICSQNLFCQKGNPVTSCAFIKGKAPKNVYNDQCCLNSPYEQLLPGMAAQQKYDYVSVCLTHCLIVLFDENLV